MTTDELEQRLGSLSMDLAMLDRIQAEGLLNDGQVATLDRFVFRLRESCDTYLVRRRAEEARAAVESQEDFFADAANAHAAGT